MRNQYKALEEKYKQILTENHSNDGEVTQEGIGSFLRGATAAAGLGMAAAQGQGLGDLVKGGDAALDRTRDMVDQRMNDMGYKMDPAKVGSTLDIYKNNKQKFDGYRRQYSDLLNRGEYGKAIELESKIIREAILLLSKANDWKDEKKNIYGNAMGLTRFSIWDAVINAVKNNPDLTKLVGDVPVPPRPAEMR